MPAEPTAVDCSPAALMEAAKCFTCISPGLQGPVMIYLLARLAGESLDPKVLMAKAVCLKCIPTGVQPEVITMLLCSIATIEGA